MLTKVNLKIIKVAVASCMVVLLSSGCSLLPKEEEALKPPLVKPVKENMETHEVKRGTIIKRTRGVGIFEATKIAYHQFKESGGVVKELMIKAGDTVAKGDVLVQLEVDGLDLDIKYKSIDLEKAKAKLEEAKQNKDVTDMKIRMMELDLAQTQYDKTMAKLNSRQLLAEMDGQVTFAADLKPGDWVDPYKVLVNVANTDGMRLTYQVISPTDIADVAVGMEAAVEFKDKEYKAKVVQTPASAPLVDNPQLQDKYSRSLYVALDGDIPKEATFGTAADINIVTERREDTIIIPLRGLRSYFGRNYVQVLDGESRTEVDVEKGIQSSTEVEILSGLKEGQLVILQ